MAKDKYGTLASVRSHIISAFDKRAEIDPDFLSDYAQRVTLDGLRNARPVGRPKNVLGEETRPMQIGKYADEHGIEATMQKFPHIGSKRTVSQYRTAYRKHYKNSR
jgi:hypothetical protein